MMGEAQCMIFLMFICFVVKNLVDNIVPDPYMDEIFHVPQAQRFWNGNYSWDPKITTLPGLYTLSNVWLRVFSILHFVENTCSIYSLRLMNTLALAYSFISIFIIIHTKRPQLSNANQAFAALTLTIFPLHFFFGFIYYTDVISTVLVLTMMCLFSMERSRASGFCGGLAVFTRQTNIIWIFLQIIIPVWGFFESQAKPYLYYFTGQPAPPSAPPKADRRRPKGRGRRGTNPRNKVIDAKALLSIWIKCCTNVFPVIYSHGLVIIAFIIFVMTNGGVAVGDKEAHQVTINIPQILYFGLFAGFFLTPVLLPSWQKTVKTIQGNWIAFIFTCIVGFFVVHFNTVVHPYLLADNRHYTFYIWKRLYEWYPVLKYALVPVSVAAWSAICAHLDLHPAMIFSHIFCIVAVLIPQALLEFRYFIIPYFLLRLEMNCFEWKRVIPEFMLYAAINVITFNIFLYKPFTWFHSGEVQRFMW